MAENYHRPGTDYVPESRPNDNQFKIYTRNLKRPVPDQIYDINFGYTIDRLNDLDIRIGNAQIQALPGINDALNVGKLLTLSQLNTISWVNITSDNILNESILGIKLVPQTITQRELADGGISTSKIAQKAITTGLLDDECVNTDQLGEFAVTSDKIAPAAVTADEIADGTITATELAANSVTTPKILDASVTLAKLAQEVIDRLIPIGTVVEFAGTAGSPAMWLECNGQAISRATYATLFTNLGTIYGAGDGATTFNLPDRRGRVAVGIGSDNSTVGRITAATADSITLGGTFGAETQTLDVTQIPSHNHSNWVLNTSLGTGSTGIGAASGGSQSGTTSSKGGGLPHPNVQPSIFTRYYIRAL